MHTYSIDMTKVCITMACTPPCQARDGCHSRLSRSSPLSPALYKPQPLAVDRALRGIALRVYVLNEGPGSMLFLQPPVYRRKHHRLSLLMCSKVSLAPENPVLRTSKLGYAIQQRCEPALRPRRCPGNFIWFRVLGLNVRERRSQGTRQPAAGEMTCESTEYCIGVPASYRCASYRCTSYRYATTPSTCQQHCSARRREQHKAHGRLCTCEIAGSSMRIVMRSWVWQLWAC